MISDCWHSSGRPAHGSGRPQRQLGHGSGHNDGYNTAMAMALATAGYGDAPATDNQSTHFHPSRDLTPEDGTSATGWRKGGRGS